MMITYSLAGAAKVIGVTPPTLRKAILRGELKAAIYREKRRSYRISKVDLEEWYRQRGGGNLFEEEEIIVDNNDSTE